MRVLASAKTRAIAFPDTGVIPGTSLLLRSLCPSQQSRTPIRGRPMQAAFINFARS